MKNIFRIFKADVKGLLKNFFALVIALGLCALPALYAWFNIYANWDPYANTGNIRIAVASLDKGWTNKDGEELNMGQNVIDNLKESDSIGWVFLDTEKEAIDGVYSGDYYAAVVIDEDFTYSMYNAIADNFTNPKITYYENQKKNAVASKITDTAVSTLQTSINEQFIKAVTETVFQTTNGISDELSDTDAVNTFIQKIDAVNENLKGYSSMIDSFVAGNVSIGDVTNDANNSLSQGQSLIGDGIGKLEEGQKGLDSTQASFQNFSTNVTNSMNQIQNSINTISNQISQAQLEQNAETLTNDMKDIMDNAKALSDEIQSLQKELQDTQKEQTEQNVQDVLNQLEDLKNKADGLQQSGSLDIDSIQESIEQQKKDLEDKVNDLNDQNQDAVNKELDGVKDKVDEIGQKAQDAVDGDTAKAVSDGVGKGVQAVQNSLSTYADTVKQMNELYNNRVVPQVNTMISNLSDTLQNVESLLTNLSSTMDGMKDIFNGVDTTLGTLNTSMSQLQGMINKTSDKLTDVLDRLEGASESEQMEIIMQLLAGDPDTYSEFFSQPVEVEDNYIYEIANYGSGVAPFYSTLAIWVGMTLLVSLVKVHADKEGLVQVKPHELFFGRYLLFFLLSQVQTLIIVLGDLYLLKIQCLHPLEFWIASAVASFTFSMLIYALTIAFGDIGKALAVVVMVIQIAGSGGTYPIEALPTFFKAVYIFFPFPYAINAMRECIGGMYQNTYSLCLVELLVFAVAGLLIGLVIRIPFIKINHYIEKRMEDTKML